MGLLFASLDKLDMRNQPNMESIRSALRHVMAERSIQPTTLSLKVGTSKTLVKDLLEKSQDVKIGTLVKLADALDVDVIKLLRSTDACAAESSAVSTVANAEMLHTILASMLRGRDERPIDDEELHSLAEALSHVLQQISFDPTIAENPGAVQAVASSTIALLRVPRRQ